MKPSRGAALAAAVLLAAWARPEAAAAQAAAAALKLNAQARAEAGLVWDGEAWTYAGASIFTLNAKAGDPSAAKLEASGSLKLAYGDAAAAAAAASGGAPPLIAGELKKLFFTVSGAAADLSVGRMILNYGRGTVLSPADLFARVDPADPAFGRIGSDVARLRLPLGDLGGFEAAASLAQAFDRLEAGGRIYGEIGGWSLAASAWKSGGAVFGFDCQGDLGAGLVAEAVVRLPEAAGGGLDLSGAAWSLMAGLDYSLGGAWFADLEYQWNSAPARPEVLFAGRHNLFASLAYRPDQWLALALRLLANPEYGTAQAGLGVSWLLGGGIGLAVDSGFAFADWRPGPGRIAVSVNAAF
jgi:hypothetical protein